MFSTTPTSVWPIFCTIAAARSATRWAAGCGVVTTIASARGISWPSERRDVARAGRHVDDEVVERAPVHVGEELLERAMQHRAAPDDRGLLLEEEPDRHHAEVVGDRRDDHPVEADRTLLDAEHARDRPAVDVGVDEADLVPEVAQREREIDRERRLADAALAGGDGDHAGALVDREALASQASRRPSGASRGTRAAASSMCEKRTSTRVDAGDARRRAWRHLALEVLLQRAPGTVRMISTSMSPPSDRDLAEHAELDDVAAQLGIDDTAHGLADRVLGRGAHRRHRIGAPEAIRRPAGGRRARRAASGRRTSTSAASSRPPPQRPRPLPPRARAGAARRRVSSGSAATRSAASRGAAPVADAVGDGDGAGIEAERSIQDERAEDRDVEGSGRVRRAGERLCCGRGIAQGSAGFHRRPRRATGRTRAACAGPTARARSSSSTPPSISRTSQSEARRLARPALDRRDRPRSPPGASRTARGPGRDGSRGTPGRSRTAAVRRGRHRRRGARCGTPSPSRSDDGRRRSPAAARRAPRRSSRAPRRRRSARAGDRCRPRRARRAGARFPRSPARPAVVMTCFGSS